MNLIQPNDPQYFEQTSDGLYDRHRYKVVDAKGDFVIVNGWEEAHQIWWGILLLNFFLILKFLIR